MSLEAKICVLGAQGVGKTSLVQRYVRGTFTPSTTASTVGASFLTKRVLDVDSGITVRLQLWDTAGQERFRSISKLYYRGASAVLLVYSIIDEHSFDEMGRWMKEIKEHIGDDVIVHIVGTKNDVVAQDPNRRMTASGAVASGVKTLGGNAAMRSAPEMERVSKRSFASLLGSWLLGSSPRRKASGLSKNKATKPARRRVTKDHRGATLTDPAQMAMGVSE
ncbi:MAG: hypothetical protein Q9206_006485 [Seirophora lacunosa]|nr:MAG: hypothetical protein LQ344_005022 [Seirophora lacunosa]